jgi:hypothetical protein
VVAERERQPGIYIRSPITAIESLCMQLPEHGDSMIACDRPTCSARCVAASTPSTVGRLAALRSCFSTSSTMFLYSKIRRAGRFKMASTFRGVLASPCCLKSALAA